MCAFIIEEVLSSTKGEGRTLFYDAGNERMKKKKKVLSLCLRADNESTLSLSLVDAGDENK